MEKFKVVWSKRAANKLFGIYSYVCNEKQEPISADALCIGLLEFSDKVASTPNAFPIVARKKRFTYRGANYKKNYKLVFRVNEKTKTVWIANIFHNKRNPQNLLK